MVVGTAVVVTVPLDVGVVRRASGLATGGAADDDAVARRPALRGARVIGAAEDARPEEAAVVGSRVGGAVRVMVTVTGIPRTAAPRIGGGAGGGAAATLLTRVTVRGACGVPGAVTTVVTVVGSAKVGIATTTGGG